MFEFVDSYSPLTAHDIHIYEPDPMTPYANAWVKCGFNRFNSNTSVRQMVVQNDTRTYDLDKNDWQTSTPRVDNITGSCSNCSTYYSSTERCDRYFQSSECYTGTIGATALDKGSQTPQRLDSNRKVRSKKFKDHYDRIANTRLSFNDRWNGIFDAIPTLRHSRDTIILKSQQLDSLEDAFDALLDDSNTTASKRRLLILMRGDLAEMLDDSATAYNAYREVTDLESVSEDSMIAGWRIQHLGLRADRTYGRLYDSLHAQYTQRIYNDLMRRIDRLSDTSSRTITTQRPTSDLKELAKAEVSIEAFPNPTSGSTELKIKLGKSGSLRLEILDVLGNVMLTESLGHRIEGIHGYTVNSSAWAAGVYYARLITEDGKVETVKLVKE